MLAAAVILLVAFGSLLAMGLPLLTAVFGIACATAIVQLLANVVTMPTFTLQTVMMLGSGVGIDYALFIVTEACVRTRALVVPSRIGGRDGTPRCERCRTDAGGSSAAAGGRCR
jgi:hypothetical protein